MATGAVYGVDYHDLVLRESRELFKNTKQNREILATLNAENGAFDTDVSAAVAVDNATNILKIGDAHIREAADKAEPVRSLILDNSSFFTVRFSTGPIFYHNCPMIQALAASVAAASKFIEGTTKTPFQLGVGSPIHTEISVPRGDLPMARRVAGLLTQAVVIAQSLDQTIQWPDIITFLKLDANALLRLTSAYIAWCEACAQVTYFTDLYRRGEGKAPQIPRSIATMHLREASGLCTRVRNALAEMSCPIKILSTGVSIANPCAHAARVFDAGIGDATIVETPVSEKQSWLAAPITQGYLCSALYYWAHAGSAGVTAACIRVASRNGANVDTGFLEQAEATAHTKSHRQFTEVDTKLGLDAEMISYEEKVTDPFSVASSTLLA